MFIINIAIKEAAVPAQKAEELLAGHRSWFTKEFEAGNFLIVGPYKDKSMAGVVLAQAASREALNAIIAQDAYYPDMAIYEVNEFSAKLVADNLGEFRD